MGGPSQYGGFGFTAGSQSESTQGSSIANNARAIAHKYPYTKHGYFGEKGRNVRIIKAPNADVAAEDFYQGISNGGKEEALANGHGVKSVLDDGTMIIYRPTTSTKNSPAVEIRNSGASEIRDQKIHFLSEGVVMVCATFNKEMRDLLRDMKGKMLTGIEYLPEDIDPNTAYGTVRVRLGSYEMDITNEQRSFPFYDSVEDMSCFSCHKATKDAPFQPFVISSKKTKLVEINETIVQVEIMNDVIHINHDEYTISFDIALIIRTSHHVYMFARDVWFSEIISIRNDDDYERVFSMRNLVESWSNEGEDTVEIDRTRIAL